VSEVWAFVAVIFANSKISKRQYFFILFNFDKDNSCILSVYANFLPLKNVSSKFKNTDIENPGFAGSQTYFKEKIIYLPHL
jgi:hypothetical protein